MNNEDRSRTGFVTGREDPTSTTYYLYDPVTGGMSEKVVAGSSTTWNDYIIADGQIVAVRIDNGTTTSWKYVVGDHLGSVTSVNGCGLPGCVVERDSYDAWGKRRNADASDDTGCTIASVLSRGFTQHEMLMPHQGPARSTGLLPKNRRNFAEIG